VLHFGVKRCGYHRPNYTPKGLRIDKLTGKDYTLGMTTPPTYDSILRLVYSWSPAQRLRLLQDVMKTLGAADVRESAVEPSPAQIAEDVRTALSEYSAGHLYEIRDANDLARLVKESGDDLTVTAEPDA